MDDYNYYIDLTRWASSLQRIHLNWLKYRFQLTQAQQRRIFQASLKASSALQEVQEVFWEKERATTGSATSPR